MSPLGKLIRNPLLLVDASGRVVEANTRARAAFAAGPAVFADPHQLRTLLVQASGSGEPILSALALREASGEVRRHRINAIRIDRAGEVAFMIQVRDVGEDQFAALTQRVRQLNAEIQVRQRVQAQLEQAVTRNRLLYRELQHRVKNHLQMMIAIVSGAQREAADATQIGFAAALKAKLAALFEAQRLMYSETGKEGVPVHELLRSIADGMQVLTGSGVTLALEAEPMFVSNDIAFPAALIANELLTNALKYASDSPDARIQSSLRREGSEAVLVISDNGPGFRAAPRSRSSSGLGLVRGLCRQIGGRLELESGPGGTRATVRFPYTEARDYAA